MDMRTRTTSWSDADLEKLCNPLTHRIWPEFGHYSWQININGKWEYQSYKEFEDYKHAYGFVAYNIALWTKELNKRKQDNKRKQKNSMRRMTRKMKQIKRIVDGDTDKLEQMIAIMKIFPEATDSWIAATLEVTDKTIKRWKKKNSTDG